jgi:hypothetical protein
VKLTTLKYTILVLWMVAEVNIKFVPSQLWVIHSVNSVSYFDYVKAVWISFHLNFVLAKVM